jgi:hypothetical protein
VYGGPTSAFMPVGLTPRDADWQIARRAPLSCRDIVRAAKTYRAVLLQVLDGEVSVFPARAPPSSLTARTQTSTPKPPLMQTYLHALLDASDRLLARLRDGPSALGVARAFVALAPELEAAFVAWFGVVGQWFTLEAPASTPGTFRTRHAAPSPTSSPASSTPGTPVSTAAERRKQARDQSRGNPELADAAQ